MTASTARRVVRVSSDQISAARALIRLRGGEDKVDPVIVKIAHALPATAADRRALAQQREQED